MALLSPNKLDVFVWVLDVQVHVSYFLKPKKLFTFFAQININPPSKDNVIEFSFQFESDSAYCIWIQFNSSKNRRKFNSRKNAMEK